MMLGLLGDRSSFMLTRGGGFKIFMQIEIFRNMIGNYRRKFFVLRNVIKYTTITQYILFLFFVLRAFHVILHFRASRECIKIHRQLRFLFHQEQAYR